MWSTRCSAAGGSPVRDAEGAWVTGQWTDRISRPSRGVKHQSRQRNPSGETDLSSGTRASTSGPVSFVVRSFSTNSRPALRVAACGGHPRAGSDTTATGDPASPSRRARTHATADGGGSPPAVRRADPRPAWTRAGSDTCWPRAGHRNRAQFEGHAVAKAAPTYS
jgi:hypothetical protein